MDRSQSEKNAKIMPENLSSNDLSNRLNQSMSVSLRNEENLQNQDESQQRSESSTHQEINCERSTTISSTNRLFEVHERMMNNLTIVSFDPQSIQNRFNNEKYLKIKFFYLILLLVMFCYTIIMVIIMCELRNSFHQRQSISEIHTKSNEKNQSFSNFDSDSDSDSNHHIHSDRHHFYQNDFDRDRTKKSFLNEMILFDSINSFIYLMAMIAVLRESYVVTMATNLTMLISLGSKSFRSNFPFFFLILFSFKSSFSSSAFCLRDILPQRDRYKSIFAAESFRCIHTKRCDFDGHCFR